MGRITFDVPDEMLPEPLGAEGIGLSEQNGRIFYPAIDSPAFGKLMRELLDSNTPLTTGGPVREQVGGLLRGILDRPPRTTVYFLFRGNEPLQVTLQLRKPVELTIVPAPQAAAPPEFGRRIRRGGPAVHRRLLELWWQQYAKTPGLLQPKPDYPPLVDTYLTATLARRLNLPLPKAKQMPSAHVGPQQGDRLQPGDRVAAHGDDAGPHSGAEQSGRAGRSAVARAVQSRRNCRFPSRRPT